MMRFLKISRCFVGMICTAGMAFAFGSDAGDLPYFTQFEEPFELGDLTGQDGWRADGAAEIREAPAPTSVRAVVLDPGQPATRIWRSFSVSKPGKPVYFDFFIRPAIGRNEDSWTLVEAGASALLFAEENGRGTLFLLDDSREDAEWIPADFSFPTISGFSPFFRVTLSQQNGWSYLFVGGRPVAVVQHGSETGAEGELVFAVGGNRMEAVEFTDFYVGTENPLPAEVENRAVSGPSRNETGGKTDGPDGQPEGSRENISAVPSDPADLSSKEVLFPDPADFASGLALQVFTPLE